jgi:hypothetical protein
MKKAIIFTLGLGLILSACMMPAFLQPATTPAPQVDLPASLTVVVQETLQALSTPTVMPSKPAVIVTPSATNTRPPVTPTETQNPILLTLTATLGTATVGVTPGPTTTGTLPPTETLHPRHFGTMPPRLPSGNITLINRSKAEAYISLQCTTKEGYLTIIEYPVNKMIKFKAPAGNYVYVAWVGGRQMTGVFGLSQLTDLTIKLYKDKIVIGK